MLDAAHLRARAAEYRVCARRVTDQDTRDQYIAVAKYLDEWADQEDARHGTPSRSDLKTG
jgi:hypothetical protein